jgi:hypothetical protein
MVTLSLVCDTGKKDGRFLFAVWAETGDFRDNAHTMAVAAMDHTQLTFPARSRTRDRKGTIL